MNLIQSNVIFDKDAHTYTLEGVELSGITTRIKERLFPDMYQDVPDSVLRKAGERGTMIHDLCEIYDLLGSDSDQLEVRDYISIVTGNHLHHEATEYLVTDGKLYASGIDKVFTDDEGNIVLVDIKTTYTLHREYVQWQLSIYKFLFELQNPGLTVSRIAAIWLRGGKSQYVDLTPYPAELVKTVLYTDEPVSINSTDDCMGKYDNSSDIISIIEQYGYWKKQYDALTKQMKDDLTATGTSRYEGNGFRFSLSAPSKTNKFDEKRFAEESPELYKAYLKEADVAPRLTVKLL